MFLRGTKMARYISGAAAAFFGLAEALSATEFPQDLSTRQPYQYLNILLTFDEPATADDSKSITVTQQGGISRSIQCADSLLFDSTKALVYLPATTGLQQLVRFFKKNQV